MFCGWNIFDNKLDLEKYNNERKSIESLLSEEVNEQAKKFSNDSVLVLSKSIKNN